MSLRINDIETCMSCANKICTYCNPTLKEKFYGLRSETTVCPVTLLQDGPLDLSENGIIDKDECINCGLCVLNCYYHCNLNCIITDYRRDDFENLSEQQYNAIACSYLHNLVGFSANTNRNKSLQFDGYVSHDSGEEAFVEVDYRSDSLESVRRILGDRLLYSPTDREITTGVVVLKELPQKGSRDVYNLLMKISQFPHTSNIKIYFTTFLILRLLALNLQHGEFELSEVMFDIMNETEEQYMERISQLIQDEDTLSQLRDLISLS
jgi:ferredoxin